MYKLVLMFASLFLLVGSPANAEGQAQDKWLVTQLSGDAHVVHAGFQPVALKVNGEISPGDTLITGLTGRATLVRGADYIVIAPHSELRLPSTPQPSGFTRVIQNVGTMLFKVRHTGIPHFAVDTPMLAAVVKGTTFTVVVDQQRSAVQVIQGAVQVTAVEGGMSRLVEGGRTVFVDHARPRTLFNADKPTPATSAPSSVNVSAAGDSPLTSIGELTGGLVRAEIGSTKTASLADPIIATTAALKTPAAGTAPSQPTEAAPATQPAPATNATTVTVQPTAPAPAAAAVTTAPAVTTPTVAPPAVTTPTVTAPSVTTTTVTTPTVTVPSVTTPTVTVPTITAPTVTVPSVTVPSVTVPSVTVPSVTTPIVTVPTVTIPQVTVPAVTIPSPLNLLPRI
jgi:hypothetical protein